MNTKNIEIRMMAMHNLRCILLLMFCINALMPIQSSAEILCKVKKTGAVVSRGSCKKKLEVAVSSLGVTSKSSGASAGTSTAASIGLLDTGAVSGGSDISTGLDVSVNRSNASGGTLNNTGLNVEVLSDGGGDSTNIGLSVSTSGADANYCAIFQGGNVGIGVSDPDEILEIAGRLHLGESVAPNVTTDRLYNLSGALYWNGQAVALGSSSSSGITSITAGTGLSGGGSTGAVSLSVNAGTSANKIVQLNSSAELPAVSGANITNLNANSISSGTIGDARLSSNVSLFGTSVSLSSGEVSGVLPISSGGTGASSLADLIALGTNTSGNYVSSVSAGSGISGGSAGSEGAALTLSVDQTFTPTWTGAHSFQGLVNVGTTTASVEALHLNGRLQLEQSSAPSTATDKLYNLGGELYFNGQNLSSGAAGGDITGVTAGTGLTGGGTNGAISLAVDVGTTANKIVQLDSSARLPAVSGLNVTNLSASNLTSGSISDSLLSAQVTTLGPDISLTTEVSGVLPVANGGTGVSSLTDLIALGTHTTGNYVATIVGSTGITLGSSGVEGGTATLSLDQSITPLWTSTHTFSGVSTDITTDTNEDFSIIPNGSGKVGIGTSSPSAMLDIVWASSSSTAGSEIGAEFNFTDTGIVSTGTDSSIGLDVNVNRTGGTGSGVFSTTGIDVFVRGDTGGSSTVTGLVVDVGSGDTNIAATFVGGSVGIGDTVSITSSNVPSGSLVLGNGSLCVDNGGNNCDDSVRSAGTIYADSTTVSGVDLAEDFPIELDDVVEAGDIVSINTHVGEKCVSYSHSQDGSKHCQKFERGLIPFVTRALNVPGKLNNKKVIGIVSTKPGLHLGGYNQEELIAYQKVPVALKGRVPLKVSLENGPIEVGDRVTISSVAGVGMRADNLEGLGVVGVALEPLESADGANHPMTILVLVK